MLVGFDDAGTGDEEELAAADGDASDIEGVICGVVHRVYLTIFEETMDNTAR
jgi:hypothetical protein